MAARADDYMVVNLDPKPPPRLDDVPGDRDVLFAGRRIAARMIMDEDQARRAEIERPADHLARIDGGLARRAFAHQLVADEHVACVEEQHAHALDRDMGEIDVQIVEQRLPAVDHRPRLHFRAQQAKCRSLDDLQRGDRAVADPGASDRLGIGGEQPAQPTKLVQQAFRDRFGIAARDGECEQIFDDLMVVQRIGADAEQPIPQPRPVPAAVALAIRHGHRA